MNLRNLVLVLFLAACGGPAVTPGPSAGDDSARPSPANGSAAPSAVSPSGTAAASLPPMPARFPVHRSMTAAEPGPDRTAAWISDAEPQELYAFYVGALEESGFVIDLEAPGGEAAILRFTAPNGTQYQLDMTGSSPIRVALGPPHP